MATATIPRTETRETVNGEELGATRREAAIIRMDLREGTVIIIRGRTVTVKETQLKPRVVGRKTRLTQV